MKSEELKKLKTEFKQLQEKRNEILKIKKEILCLKEKNDVKRYLELINLFQEKTTGRYSEFDTVNDEKLLNIALSKVNIKPDDQIYVYMGTYKYSPEIDIIHGSNDILVSRTNQNADYVIYKNLEARYNGIVEIPYKKVDDFEKKHRIIVPQNVVSKERYFYELQTEYFKIMILESPESATRKINELIKSKKK